MEHRALGWSRYLLGSVCIIALSVGLAAFAHDKDNNPPGKVGGKGTNWENPPGPAGGAGASPDRKHSGWKHRHRHHQRDRDNNPPGPAGGRGTNWENRPGPAGGPGTSPNRRHR